MCGKTNLNYTNINRGISLQNIFFTSDLHLNHNKVILPEYCNRPFTDIKEMNEALIYNWNYTVRANDKVYVLGDFAFGDPEPFLKQLKGYKILIKGNHDRYSNDKALRKGFNEVYDLKTIKMPENTITLCHFPMYSWSRSHFGAWHLHGHNHNYPIDFHKYRYNVGVDVNDFTPISYEEIKIIFANQLEQSINNSKEQLHDEL